MSKHDAILAYRDSRYDAARYDQERRIDSRMIPIVGGMWDSAKLAGNSLWRPIKVTKALFGSYKGDEARDFPKMPEVPSAFDNSSLGNAFSESWKLKEEAEKARVESFSKMLNVDLPGWLQKSSIANYAEAKDTRVIFPEEGIAHDSYSYSNGGNSSLPRHALKMAVTAYKH